MISMEKFKKFLLISILIVSFTLLHCAAMEYELTNQDIQSIFDRYGWNYFSYYTSASYASPGNYNFFYEDSSLNRVYGRSIIFSSGEASTIYCNIPLYQAGVNIANGTLIVGFSDSYSAGEFTSADFSMDINPRDNNDAAPLITYSVPEDYNVGYNNDWFYFEITFQIKDITSLNVLRVRFNDTGHPADSFFVGLKDVTLGSVSADATVISNSINSIQNTINELNNNITESQTNISNQIDTIIYGKNEWGVYVSELNANIRDAVSSLESIADVMSSIEYPDISDITMSFDDIKPDRYDSDFASGFLAPIFNFKPIYSILLLVFGVATVSYILYGKKN